MRPKIALIAGAAVLAVLVAGFVVTNSWDGETPAHALRPNDAQVVALGEGIYARHCASCHGARLEGQPNWRSRGPDGLLPAPPHDASGHTWHHPDEQLFRITKHGVAKVANLADYTSAMPVYDGVLSDDEIVAALSWVKSQWPPTVREKHDALNAQSLKASVR